jgi:DNA-binding transcriptional MerR regulator
MLAAHLSTGELAALVDRSPATIRRYEAQGIIPTAQRDPVSGRRYWTHVQVELIQQRLQLVMADTKSARRDCQSGCDLGANANGGA